MDETEMTFFATAKPLLTFLEDMERQDERYRERQEYVKRILNRLSDEDKAEFRRRVDNIVKGG